ncbi:CD9 antigen [Lamellibrachia satsuma]|nr:CD9 antigen [Lamellibrachia satsuma]
MLLLGLAVYMRIDPNTNHYVKAGYSTEINTFHIICYILMASGGVMTFVGFLGCCGAFQESRCMLGTFFVMLFLVLATDISGCVWAYMQRDQAKKSVTQTFRNFVVTKYGKDSHTDETIDFVQTSLPILELQLTVLNIQI